MLRNLLAGLTLVALGVVMGSNLRFDAAIAQLQPPPGGVKRTILQKTDVPGTNLETIVALVEAPANFKAGKHNELLQKSITGKQLQTGTAFFKT